jgi:hypothetical protein
MPDPIETMLKTEAEVTRLWNQARPDAGNRDVQAMRGDVLPFSPRIFKVRAAIAAGDYETDDKYPVAEERFIDTHFPDVPKTDHGHPSLAERIDCETPAAEEEAEYRLDTNRKIIADIDAELARRRSAEVVAS